MATVYLYCLSDPRDGRVRYIGKTIDRDKRLTAHIYARRERLPVNRWINKLHNDGIRPKMVILEEACSENWEEREKYWIAVFRETHKDLLNVADGGQAVGPRSESAIVAYYKGREINYLTVEGLNDPHTQEALAHAVTQLKRFIAMVGMSRSEKEAFRNSNPFTCLITYTARSNSEATQDRWPAVL